MGARNFRPNNINQSGLKYKRAITTLVCVLFAAACVPGQAAKYDPNPNINVPKKWGSYAKSEPVLQDDTWLKSFRSKQLIQLVDEALSNNRDLHAAAARVDESRAIARSVGAGLYPSVSATVGAGRRVPVRSIGPVATTTYDVGLEVAWEADIWGRIRGARAGAALDAIAVSKLYDFVRQSIAAQVVDRWLVIKGDRALVAIARQEVNTRRKVVENITARVQEQALIAADENWAKAELSRAMARRSEANGRLLVSTRALEVLLGRYPGAQFSAAGSLPRLPGRVPVGMPSEILERRPDIAAAERRVAAAYHRSREARAARLPRITLAANLTGTGARLGNALSSDNLVWGLFGGIIAPIVTGGRLKADEVAANARQTEALANYGAAALRAFQEVGNAISNEHYLQRQLNHLWRASTELRQAIALEKERYELAEIDIFRLDEARIRFYAVQRDSIATQVALLRNRVQMHLALGGSFVEKLPAEEVSATAAKKTDG